MTKLSRTGIAFAVVVGGSGVGCGGGGLKLPRDGGGADAAVGTPVVISTATRQPRKTTLSVNYWQWAPTYGDYTTGTESLVAALRPALMRVGGYNNAANSPDRLADAEMDRLRNLVFMRHIENPENIARQASLQVIFMTQSLERAGDHVKNLAEEICHLVSGHTLRHVLMAYDKPIEQMFIDWLRTREEKH